MRRTIVAALLLIASLSQALAAETPKTAPAEPAGLSRFVAIDNVCAWPNLTLQRDGSITAIIFGQPSHGLMEGDTECWGSSDGLFWSKRGVAAAHEPTCIRMNAAAGLAKNGDLVVLCSGWTDTKQEERPKQPPFRDAILRSWVCRSSDGGRTWARDKEFPAPPPGWCEYVPFGPIALGADGALHATCYNGQFADPTKSSKSKGGCAWHFISTDDGRHWQTNSVIGPKHNETSLLHLDGPRWLAAARIDATEIFRSEDDGKTWVSAGRVTARNEINAHLARLKDGRLLLTYGSRIKGQCGVLAKFSADEGKTWGAPLRLANSLEWDCGYPSSVQRADGQIVTAWYSKASEYHQRYHMAVALWAAQTN